MADASIASGMLAPGGRMVSLRMLGTESLGVRGLSCYIEDKDTRVLIDPGVALGYTRWHYHPHPVQAVAGDLVRTTIGKLWVNAEYIVFTHMHGDHVPLYNANPFQLSLYDLGANKHAEILAPASKLLGFKERTRLAKIKELYHEKVVEISQDRSRIGPLEFYGPFPHGLNSSYVYMILADFGVRVVHLSDMGLLVDMAADTARRLKPDIVITDGPPIYRYLHDKYALHTLLRRAERNLSLIVGAADTVIINHHVNRCDQGYKWIMRLRREYSAITTAAEYVGSKPLLLEAWRRTLYRYLPIEGDWFKEDYQDVIARYKRIYEAIRRSLTDMNNVLERDFAHLLERIVALG